MKTVRTACVLAAALAFLAGSASQRLDAQGQPAQITWTFDSLERIGGLPVKVEGNPKVIDSPAGKAVEFDGVDDIIFIDKHPLAGAATYTFEAIVRPDGGAPEQRFFHLAERDANGTLANKPIRACCSSSAASKATSGTSTPMRSAPAIPRGS
jgi:hypothetical protein